jgi:hypothetical protein
MKKLEKFIREWEGWHLAVKKNKKKEKEIICLIYFHTYYLFLS